MTDKTIMLPSLKTTKAGYRSAHAALCEAIEAALKRAPDDSEDAGFITFRFGDDGGLRHVYKVRNTVAMLARFAKQVAACEGFKGWRDFPHMPPRLNYTPSTLEEQRAGFEDLSAPEFQKAA